MCNDVDVLRHCLTDNKILERPLIAGGSCQFYIFVFEKCGNFDLVFNALVSSSLYPVNEDEY